MGSWGYEPYDNDDAADWFYDLDKTGVYDFIENGLNSKEYGEQRAAAWLIQRLAVTSYVYDVNKIDKHRELAVEKLQVILSDKNWINEWKNSDKIIASIKQQICEIENPNSSPGLLELISNKTS